MPGKKHDILWVIGLFLCALLLRSYVLTCLPVRPITDDAYEYNYIAQNISRILSNEAPEDRQAFLYLSAKRGLLYPSFIAVVYALFGPHPRHVLLLQVLIDSLTCILVYALGREVFNKTVGTTAATLAILYPAFPYYATMLFQETTTIFLLTLFMLLLARAISQNKPLLYFFSGLLAAVLSFYRSGFLPFAAFTAPVLLFITWRYRPRDHFRPFIYYVVGALCLFILYAALSYRLTGSVTLNKPSIAWSIYETTHRDGWTSDTFAPTPTDELREVARDHSYPIIPDAHQLGLPPRIYIMATVRSIQKQPVRYLSQLIARCKRMWTYVETFPGKWHSPIVRGQLTFHRLLIVLALVGIPLSLGVWHHSLLFIAVFLYLTIAYIPIIGLPRYAVPAMPFVILIAAYAALRILSVVADERQRLASLPGVLLCGTAAGIVVIAWYFDVATLLALFPHAPPPLLHIIIVIVINVACITIAILLYRLFTLSAPMGLPAVTAAALSLLAVMIVYTNHDLTSKTWQEWHCLLFSPHQKIRQTILLPADFNVDDYDRAALMIDMFPGGGHEYDLQVTANGEVVQRYQGGIKSSEVKFDKKFFGLYKSFLFDGYKLKPEDLRQWYEIDLPLTALDQRSFLTIECFLGGKGDGKENFVLVFGDYTTVEKNFYAGPCFPESDADTSMVKIMPYDGDYRFEQVTPLYSAGTNSAYHNGVEWQENDLSSVRGIQSGGYRIRVKLTGKDGRQVIL